MTKDNNIETWDYYKDSSLYKNMTLSSYQNAASGTLHNMPSLTLH